VGKNDQFPLCAATRLQHVINPTKKNLLFFTDDCYGKLHLADILKKKNENSNSNNNNDN